MRPNPHLLALKEQDTILEETVAENGTHVLTVIRRDAFPDIQYWIRSRVPAGAKHHYVTYQDKGIGYLTLSWRERPARTGEEPVEQDEYWDRP